MSRTYIAYGSNLNLEQMQQEIIQDEQSSPAGLLHPFLVFGVVSCLEGYQLLQQGLAVVVLHLVWYIFLSSISLYQQISKNR